MKGREFLFSAKMIWMIELGIEKTILENILSGAKTIEVRLGKPKFLRIKVGEVVSLREDIWKDGEIVHSTPGKACIQVTQVLFFESFEEMLASINYEETVPMAQSLQDAINTYRKFYTEEEEKEFGVVAFYFKVISA